LPEGRWNEGNETTFHSSSGVRGTAKEQDETIQTAEALRLKEEEEKKISWSANVGAPKKRIDRLFTLKGQRVSNRAGGASKGRK